MGQFGTPHGEGATECLSTAEIPRQRILDRHFAPGKNARAHPAPTTWAAGSSGESAARRLMIGTQ